MLKSNLPRYSFNFMRFLFLEGFNNLILQIKQHYGFTWFQPVNTFCFLFKVIGFILSGSVAKAY